jgi:hypothetical protein
MMRVFYLWSILAALYGASNAAHGRPWPEAPIPKEVAALQGAYTGSWTSFGIDAQGQVVRRMAWTDTMKAQSPVREASRAYVATVDEMRFEGRPTPMKVDALAIGFGPSERASEAIFSIAVFPRWVSLFFLQSGAKLSDPRGLLKGTGKRARHIVLQSAADLDTPGVQDLMKRALARAVKAIDSSGPNRIVIKSVSAKQRPRRPGTC